ncbi:protein of unknown function (plasmid) [Azospirillum baldaniorum]|uniref:Uncharacterized protein n=1 Tax=Azospirillum baldaniorum TaxID=1064539 RepID=A0A9P1JW58_9PROT|nr:protein of unknown function [Azospirillum baldaniorum]
MKCYASGVKLNRLLTCVNRRADLLRELVKELRESNAASEARNAPSNIGIPP